MYFKLTYQDSLRDERIKKKKNTREGEEKKIIQNVEDDWPISTLINIFQ